MPTPILSKDMLFLKNFKKELSKMENVSTEFSPPEFWYTTGNYALNKVLSGSYFKAVPQGRLTALVGPSAVGKSYVICNLIREAQKVGSYVLVLDSENALDPVFMRRTGIDTGDDKLTYVQVVTIQDVTRVLSEFLTGYEKEYGRFNKDAPKILIVLDSLGNCLTDSENAKFDQGVQTGDQGASAKAKKHLMRTLVSRVARCNTAFVFTDQVYPADPMAGDGLWTVTNGVKYAASQIALLTKLKLKAGADVIGIRMRVETYKSRFVKPGTKIELEIPYDTGLSSISGLIDALVDDGVIEKSGSWLSYDIDGKSTRFQRGDFTEDMALTLLATHPTLIKSEQDFEKCELGVFEDRSIDSDDNFDQVDFSLVKLPTEELHLDQNLGQEEQTE